jgi:hypothetical protein
LQQFSDDLPFKREYFRPLYSTSESPIADRALADYSKPFTLFYSKENGPKFGARNKEEPKYYTYIPYERGLNDLFVESTETVAPRGGFFYVPGEYFTSEDESYRFVNPAYVALRPDVHL